MRAKYLVGMVWGRDGGKSGRGVRFWREGNWENTICLPIFYEPVYDVQRRGTANSRYERISFTSCTRFR